MTGADFRRLGELTLKNIEQPVQAFQVSATAADADESSGQPQLNDV